MRTMNAVPAKRRPRFRFGLRTLLLFVTAAAVASFAYWVAWPRWLIYREQVRFEESVKQLRAGARADEVWSLHSWHKPDLTMHAGGAKEGTNISLTRYVWPNALYFIYYVTIANQKYSSAGAPSLS